MKRTVTLSRENAWLKEYADLIGWKPKRLANRLLDKMLAQLDEIPIYSVREFCQSSDAKFPPTRKPGFMLCERQGITREPLQRGLKRQSAATPKTVPRQNGFLSRCSGL
jgi:hypothetical protein